MDDLVPFVPTSVDQRQPDQLPHDAFRKTALVGTGSAAQSPTLPDIKTCGTSTIKETATVAVKERSP